MNRSQQRDLFRLIRATRSRFFSLTAIVTLGVAFFVGVSAVSTIMAYSVDQYDDAYALKDITVYSDFGFDEADVDAVRQLDDVRDAEGAKFVDVTAVSGSRNSITRIHSWSEDMRLNHFVLRTGRLPEKPGEALAENGTELIQGFSLGSTVQLYRPDDDLDDWLVTDTLTIVGTIDTPVYLNQTKENSTLSNQYIGTYLYVTDDTFVPEYYTEMNVLTVAGEEMNTFSDAYDDYDAAVKKKIETLAETQADVRRDRIVSEAMDEYKDGLAEYEDGLQEFNEAIADAEKELADARKEIAAGQKQLDDGIKQLQDGQAELDAQKAAAETELAEARKKIADGAAELEAGKKEFAAAEAEMNANLATIDDAIRQLQDAQATLSALKAMQAIVHDPAMQDLLTQLEALPEDMKDMSVDELIDLLPQLKERLKELEEEGGVSIDTPGDIKNEVNNLKNRIAADQAVLQSETAAAWRTALAAMAEDEMPTETDAEVLTVLSSWCPELAKETAGEILAAWQETETRINAADEAVNSAEADAAMAAMDELDPDLDLTAFLDIDPEQLHELYHQLNEYLPEGEKINTVRDLIEAMPKLIEQLDAAVKAAEDELRAQGFDPDHLDQAISDLQQTRQQIVDGLAAARQELADGEAELKKGRSQLEAGEREFRTQIEAAQKTINEGWQEVAENREKLADARRQLAEGEQELADKKLDGEQELNDAKADLDKALQDIQDLGEGNWTVLDRSQHYATATYRSTVEQMQAIANIFPVFFILVAALVCLTTMTRMVAEQRGQIGIMRALGYTRLQCAAKYLVYAGLATGIGIVLGCIVGLATFPAVIYHTWRMMYILPVMKLKMPWGLAGVTAVVFLLIMEWTTWQACKADMVEVPAQLMRPKAPQMGRKTLLEHLGFLWQRLSFTGKVTVRNLIRYKRRFIMTVIGVAGCCALLVTGFGVRDSINSMVDLQFYELMKTDGMARLDNELTASEAVGMQREMAGRSDVAKAVLAGSYSAQAWDRTDHDETVFAQVFDDAAEMEEVYVLRTRRGHNEIIPADDGVIISEKFAENFDLSVGDTFVMESRTGVRREVKVNAIMEMYIHHYVLMTKAYYRSVFGTDMRENTLFIKAAADGKQLQKEIVSLPGISEIEFNDATLENFRTMVKGIDAVVWVLIISSMSLAFVVLGNLTNVNISERQREIATLKVLGFRPREVQSYIYKENNILTAIGALAGLPLGNILHHYIMRQVEMNYVMFGRSLLPASFVLAWVLTIVFGLIVNRSMNRRLHQIEMVESLKSVE